MARQVDKRELLTELLETQRERKVEYRGYDLAIDAEGMATRVDILTTGLHLVVGMGLSAALVALTQIDQLIDLLNESAPSEGPQA